MRTLTPPAGSGAPGAPPIDPRIRQRRIAVTRHQGRRRLRVLVGALTVGVAIAGAVLVLHLSWFRVSHIQVRGAARSGAARVDAAAGVALHQPLLSVDTALVARRVERLPWVATVRVTKSWPSTLVVTVDERAPVAQVADGPRWALVDGAGRVLAVDSNRAPGLVVLAWGGAVPGTGSELGAPARGPLAVAAGLGAFTATGSSVPAPVVSVSTGPGGGVAVDLADGAVVDLGPPTDLTAKLTALATVESEVDLSGVKSIDLRVPGQPVLTRG
ncbi:MAG TPA: FtsQ-type POTRA domain-containing protein [Acidimicrobiales bacterium]|nr:FtsQ-type POTRA domain-containing protein [Acidimicrobiales bacterium]